MGSGIVVEEIDRNHEDDQVGVAERFFGSLVVRRFAGAHAWSVDNNNVVPLVLVDL